MRFHRYLLSALLSLALAANALAAETKKKIVFIAGKPSHNYGAHEHNAGCDILARSLKQALPGAEIDVYHNGWPADEKLLAGADTIVMYCDGGGGHMVLPHKKEVDALAKKGTGIVCLHYAVEVPKENGGQEFLDWIGGYFEMNWSVNPHWDATFDKFPNHPTTRGVKPFTINDEWYYHMRFRPGMQGVTPILSSLPPASTLSRPDGPHEGNPDVRRDVLEKKEPQIVAWASENAGGGRGFGFTGGHDHWNWGDPNFRKLVLNAIAWTAKIEVPADGIGDKPVMLDDLAKNLDKPAPANFDREAIRKRIGLPPDDAGSSKAPTKKVQAVFTSKTVSTSTPGRAVDIDVDIAGAKQLYLVVTDGGDNFACDWADWCEPRLVGPSGELKLTELKWKQATSDWGNVNTNQRADGGALRVDGKPIVFGIGTHANSLIAYDLPPGYQRFKARGGLDEGGTNQGGGSTVDFSVYTQNPGLQISFNRGGAGALSHFADDAATSLDVAEGCQVTLFSSEPQISNIVSIDVDHLGRVWACEVKNYRRFNGSRPEGDRILVLEDTNGDGRADKETVFYQGRDVDTAHGICVLGNRVIVSAGDKVQAFYDDDGDLKADRKETLFSGIGGVQHDHGIHAFSFAADGKLYFNMGNEGKTLRDKDGNPIIDLDGKEVINARQPYQDGMVFRCNLDGSELETLAWNFRNNWEVTVDSFGNIWQSDNDDDGNRGCRINYVLEYGNYGYKDELTGAGWREPRSNQEATIPERHWHLNDPGVVPNLLQTGAGAPTGITFYEGTLLPEAFRGAILHCDPGVNICRAYPVTKDGAGFKAEIANIVYGARDNWFRPDDVCVAPDGSLMVADWYDPGVGGHNQQEVDKGRIFRVAPADSKYNVPKLDLATPAGIVQALASPNGSARYLAYQAAMKLGKEMVPALANRYFTASDPAMRARAVWLWGQMEGQGENAVSNALAAQEPDLRIVGIRLAYRLKMTPETIVSKMCADPDPGVRRQCAIALRHRSTAVAPVLWAALATKYDGQDRWYLEALGIGADQNWDECLAAYLSEVDERWNSPAGRDIIWRSRAAQTPALLAKIISDPATKSEDIPRFLRALDFQAAGPEKEKALLACLTAVAAKPARSASETLANDTLVAELLLRLTQFDLDSNPQIKAAVFRYLKANPGSDFFLRVIERFAIKDLNDLLVNLALTKPGDTAGVKAAELLIIHNDGGLLAAVLTGDDEAKAVAAATALGGIGGAGAIDLLKPLVVDAARPVAVRSAVAKALGKSKPGQQYLLELVKAKTLPGDLTFTAANVLLASPLPEVREEAGKYLQLPAAADAKPLPPMSELVKMRGNAAHGKELFNDKATCAKCHIVAGQGKEVGPNLSEIGNKLAKDALLASILDPNAGISHNYETWLAVTDDGRTISGLLVSKTDAEVVLKDATAVVHTLKTGEVDELKKLPTSLMPSDLQKLLTAQDLIDVVEYLGTLKKQ